MADSQHGGATDNKYDRQIRLWGTQGQKALTESSICLVYAGPTGTETLKNLVLPGCGNISIVDGAITQMSDLGNNFFYTKQDIGTTRAEACLKNLLEMNPDVQGEAFPEDPHEKVNRDISFFEKFDIVIVTGLCRQELIKLSKHLWNKNIPLLIARSYGLIGYTRFQRQAHPVRDAKPQGRDQKLDLRLDQPFPELEALVDDFDLGEESQQDSDDQKMQRHVPYPVLLLKLFRKWTQEGNALPQTRDQKKKFKAYIEGAGYRYHINDGSIKEAVQSSYLLWTQPDYRFVEDAIKDERPIDPSSPDNKFFIMMRTLRRFMREVAPYRTPLTSSLPDMTASTDLYLRLQKAYQERSRKDQATFETLLEANLKDLGLSRSHISDEELSSFISAAQFVTCVRSRSVEEELCGESNRDHIMEHLQEAGADDHPFKWKLYLQAVDLYAEKYGDFPGTRNKTEEDEGNERRALIDLVNSEIERMDLSNKFHDILGEERSINSEVAGRAYAEEIQRYEGHELHNIASIVGGVASQEVVKILTNQFIPVNNTWIFNGIVGESVTMEL